MTVEVKVGIQVKGSKIGDLLVEKLGQNNSITKL